MGYRELSDEDKLDQAIRFVATDQPLPVALTEFLHEAGLYDAIVLQSEDTCHRSKLEG